MVKFTIEISQLPPERKPKKVLVNVNLDGVREKMTWDERGVADVVLRHWYELASAMSGPMNIVEFNWELKEV